MTHRNTGTSFALGPDFLVVLPLGGPKGERTLSLSRLGTEVALALHSQAFGIGLFLHPNCSSTRNAQVLVLVSALSTSLSLLSLMLLRLL